MTTKLDVRQARLKVDQARAALDAFWLERLDKHGNFSWVFGDPTAVFGVLVWVGYNKRGKTVVKVEQVLETSKIEAKAKISENDLYTIKQVAYELSKLLDTDVAQFSQGIYRHLQDLSNHPSFFDILYDDWIKTKDDLTRVVSAYKATLDQAVNSARKQKQEDREEKKKATRFSKYLNAFSSNSTKILWQNEGLSQVSPAISRLIWIQEVNLGNNSLSSVPPILFKLPKLKRLYLFGNQITALPSMVEVPELEVLDVHDNCLASLPDDIHLLTQLQAIDLEKNKIRTLPDNLGELNRLAHLNVARNLVSIVPPWVTELPQLTFLKLTPNPIVNLPPKIRMKGSRASIQYMKQQLISANVQPTSITGDFTLRLGERASNNLNSCESTVCGDLIVRSNTGDEIQVHRLMLASRSSVLADRLKDSSKMPLTVSKTGLPVLEMNMNSYLLETLMTYLYSDEFESPKLELMEVGPHIPDSETVFVLAHNAELVRNFEDVLSSVSGLASEFNLPHLQYLVQGDSGGGRKVDSHFLEDFKLVYDFSVSNHTVLSYTSSDQLDVAVPSFTSQYRWFPPCDVSFSFPNHPDSPLVHAHRMVLSARSSFMKSMLTSKFREAGQDVVEIGEIHPAVFKRIVEFCYTDNVIEFCGDTILDLLLVARMSGLNRLLEIVASVIGHSLDTDNVAGILLFAQMNSFGNLVRNCKFFILSNWGPVTRSVGWADVPHNLVQQLTTTAIEWGIILDNEQTSEEENQITPGSKSVH